MGSSVQVHLITFSVHSTSLSNPELCLASIAEAGPLALPYLFFRLFDLFTVTELGLSCSAALSPQFFCVSGTELVFVVCTFCLR